MAHRTHRLSTLRTQSYETAKRVHPPSAGSLARQIPATQCPKPSTTSPPSRATLPSPAPSIEGLAAASEWPTLRTYLPSLTDLCFLYHGCGFGWFARWVRSAGAASVRGVDISEWMLGRAREMMKRSRTRGVDLNGGALGGSGDGHDATSLARWHRITSCACGSSWVRSTGF